MARFRQPWWIIAILAALIVLGLTACGEPADESAVEPAADRPTFVWIFSDP